MRNMALPIKHEDLILTDPCYPTVNLRLFVLLRFCLGMITHETLLLSLAYVGLKIVPVLR